MSRFGIDYTKRTDVPAPQHIASFPTGFSNDGHEERGSMSGSEDGSYAPKSDALKPETDVEDETMALTSQTLNPDGTPKRPMNAFMIFARRRRPQVSAENQAMRTGEISKVLSKEWSSMQAADKQFYQEQAKQLKDSFNTKYPDYVYRRRPNNSRRPRRKTEGGARPTENTSSLDTKDDGAFDDVGESPTDSQGSHISDIITDPQRPRMPHDVQTFADHIKVRSSPSRASPYPYPSTPATDQPLRSIESHDSSVYHSTFTSSAVQPQRSPSTLMHHTPSLNYQYVATQGSQHSHSPSMHIPESARNQNTWSTPAIRPSSWLGGSPDPPPVQRTYPSLTETTISSVSTSTSWHSGSPSTSSTSHSYGFPILNSPFYPSPQSERLSTPSHMTPPLNPSQPQPMQLQGHDYDNHDHFTSPSSYHSGSDRDAFLYSHVPGAQRALPSISTYPQPESSELPSTGGNGHQGYWRRD